MLNKYLLFFNQKIADPGLVINSIIPGSTISYQSILKYDVKVFKKNET